MWLKPLLVGDFEYTEWTGDRHLRLSSFVGLVDKKAKDVVGNIRNHYYRGLEKMRKLIFAAKLQAK